MNKPTQILLLVIIVGAAIALTYFAVAQKRFQKNIQPQACFKNKCYGVEIAKNAEEQERGLMFRQQLDNDKGMLFEFPGAGVYPFWMKNTLIPLDMVWLDSGGKVVFIYADAQPCREDYCANIDPKVNAVYVLEVNAGQMVKIGAKIGDQVTLPK